MAAGKASPAVVEQVMAFLSAYIDRHQLVARGIRCRLASREQVGSRPADCILEDVGEKDGQAHRYGQTKKSRVGFLLIRAQDGGPNGQERYRYRNSVYQKHYYSYPY